jgi:hypothetical protein
MIHHKVRCDRDNRSSSTEPNIPSSDDALHIFNRNDAIRRPPKFSSLIFYVACFSCFQMAILAPLPAFSQILIEPRALAPEDILVTKTIYAIRKIPDAIVSLDPKDKTYFIPAAAVLGSASLNPALSDSDRAKIASGIEAGRGDPRQRQEALDVAVKNWQPSNYAKDTPLETWKTGSSHEPVMVDFGTTTTYTTDAFAIENIVKYGHQSAGTTKVSYDRSTDGLKLDPAFAGTLASFYKSINYDSSSSFWDVNSSDKLADATRIAQADRRIALVSLDPMGKADFGKPIIVPIREKHLVVEASTLSQYEVYWIEFAFTPDEDLSKNSSEMSFTVSLSDTGSIALQLLPMRFGVVEDHTEKSGPPEFSLEQNGKKVTIGKVYEQSVEYSFLKPTIMARGLQGSSFGWIMKDSMVDPSAKRFVAILGVPKGTRELLCNMTIRTLLKGDLVHFYQDPKTIMDQAPALLKFSR